MKNILLIIAVVLAGGVARTHFNNVAKTQEALESVVPTSAVIVKPDRKDAMEGIIPDNILLGVDRDSYTGASDDLHVLVTATIAQFSQKTLNKKLATIFDDRENGVMLLELLGERGYKNDLYVIDTKSNKVLWTQSNKISNKKVIGFLGDYIIFEEGCVDGCTIPVNIRIQNWKTQKKITLGSAGDLHMYVSHNRIGYKIYTNKTTPVDGPDQCLQTNCCDDRGSNCKVTTNEISTFQLTKNLP